MTAGFLRCRSGRQPSSAAHQRVRCARRCSVAVVYAGACSTRFQRPYTAPTCATARSVGSKVAPHRISRLSWTPQASRGTRILDPLTHFGRTLDFLRTSVRPAALPCPIRYGRVHISGSRLARWRARSIRRLSHTSIRGHALHGIRCLSRAKCSTRCRRLRSSWRC